MKMIKNKEQRKTSENFVCFVELKLGQCDGEGLGGEELLGGHWSVFWTQRAAPPAQKGMPQGQRPHARNTLEYLRKEKEISVSLCYHINQARVLDKPLIL